MKGVVSLLLLLCCVRATVSLECLSCADVHNVSQCVSTTCHSQELCYTSVIGNVQLPTLSYGCKPRSECVNVSVTSRATRNIGLKIYDVRDVTSEQQYDYDPYCDSCCDTDYCNRHLCRTKQRQNNTNTNPGCQDDPDYACEMINSTFGICSDILHAKTVCRKFCGLCDLVDGNWGAWGEWSGCHQTCGVSQRTRTRKCDNPPPAHNGTDCVGAGTEYKNCTGSPCPVHGQWSVWASWAQCSVTCGVGLARRNRSCDNPPPAFSGDHCYGDPSQYKICMEHACQDGVWSAWGTWTTCTATCDGGLQSRTRTCNKPPPSLLGETCRGHSIEYLSCNTKACVVPASHVTGPPTPDQAIYFSVSTPTGKVFLENIPEFSHTIINEGRIYDPLTGKVNIPLSGIYEFSVTFITTNTTSQCLLRKNRETIVYAYTRDDHNGWKTASASTYVHCDKGDIVDISCGHWEFVDHNASTMFSGALVHADVIHPNALIG